MSTPHYATPVTPFKKKMPVFLGINADLRNRPARS
jgi:hypothetical protein